MFIYNNSNSKYISGSLVAAFADFANIIFNCNCLQRLTEKHYIYFVCTHMEERFLLIISSAVTMAGFFFSTAFDTQI